MMCARVFNLLFNFGGKNLNTPNALGIKIKDLRGGDSQEEFSKKIGISQNSLCRYETGQRTPNIQILKRICAVTGVDMRWLTSENVEPLGYDSSPQIDLVGGKPTKMQQAQLCAQNFDDQNACMIDDLPARLVKLRNGQARRTFAERMGTTESTLRNYEKGVSSPTADFLGNVCKILRISPEWLLFGETSLENKGGQFFPPSALGNTQACSDGANMLSCPGCVALDRVLQLERVERQTLTRENAELREELAQLRERLKQSGGPDGTASVPLAHTA